jgi:hypothetical protein
MVVTGRAVRPQPECGRVTTAPTRCGGCGACGTGQSQYIQGGADDRQFDDQSKRQLEDQGIPQHGGRVAETAVRRLDPDQ